jgi:hypothetical protein
MVLYVHSSGINHLVKGFLGMGLTHVSTPTPFCLDRVPGIFGHSSSDNT